MTRTNVIRALAAVAVVAAIAVPASSAFGSGTLNGAGSTLVQPFVQTVFSPDFKSSSGNQVNYSGVGSSAGIAAITGKTVDFGASDAPLTSSQQSACGCVEIPWALSATGPAFNIKGVAHLNLSGKVLAGIYLGTITSWTDPAIKAINKGVALPNEKIVPVYRSDGSGDTHAFTNFLSHSDSDWASKVGLGTAVQWPTGTSAKGNSGVAGVISATEGSIGYVSTFYVRDNKLNEASVENNAGKFVDPYIQDISAAAALVTHVSPNAPISIVNPAWTKPKKGAKLTQTEKLQQIAYPISTYTYVIVPSQPKQSDLLKQFLTFAITPAEQKKGAQLVFAPLPSQTVKADTTAINGL
ncbi:MAG: phosphate ABC transporter substrate-binding protein PstS [Solirubrobacteraceae bacterium]